jgi:hypothetical protein
LGKGKIGGGEKWEWRMGFWKKLDPYREIGKGRGQIAEAVMVGCNENAD